jgi:hypothetical protein
LAAGVVILWHLDGDPIQFAAQVACEEALVEAALAGNRYAVRHRSTIRGGSMPTG